MILTKKSMDVYISLLKYPYDLDKNLPGPHPGADKVLGLSTNPVGTS